MTSFQPCKFILTGRSCEQDNIWGCYLHANLHAMENVKNFFSLKIGIAEQSQSWDMSPPFTQIASFSS